ncbi:MAG TPA: redoxin domain-containing protein [Ktedonobacteraceae bacterium]|nr:redoxin domain-containing protein [Ktedonobacteraceae bacterium]
MQGIWLVAFIAQWILLLLLAFLMIQTMRFLRLLSRRLPPGTSIKVGDHISDFELPDIHNQPVSINSLLGHDKSTLLLFVRSTCSSCRLLVKHVARAAQQRASVNGLPCQIVFVCSGKRADIEKMMNILPEVGDITVLVDKDEIVFAYYNIQSTPFGLAINSAGKVYSLLTHPAGNWFDAMCVGTD